MARRRKYHILDSWAFVKGDATQENIDSISRSMRASWRHAHPKMEVRTFKRGLRAGGAYIDITAVVARVRLPEVPK